MTTRFAPASRLRGQLTPPPDKSISHRAALFAAMCDEPVLVRNYLDAHDTNSTLTAIAALGAGIDEGPAGELTIRGVGLHTAAPTTGGLLNVGNAGTLLRILPGWLAGQPGGTWTLDGDASIRRRPIDRVAEPLERMGARVEAREGRLPPVTIHGAQLAGIDYELPVASAQVKSCVLTAGLFATGQTTVTEPNTSRDHTERILARARVPLTRDGLSTTVSPVDELELDEIVVPGDPSSAAFFVAAAAITAHSRIVLSNVALNWTRAGFLRIAQRMGAVVVADLEQRPAQIPDSEPVGDVDVAAAPLVATTVTADEVPLAIDELPLVALLGCFAEGETRVEGAAELRLKESDRITGVVGGLRGLGADIEATADGFVVRGAGGLAGGVIDAHGDHRMAMLGAVAGLASETGVEVAGMDAAAVSYPSFETDLATLLSG